MEAKWLPIESAPHDQALLLSWDGQTRVGKWSQHYLCWVTIDHPWIGYRARSETPQGWQHFPAPLPNCSPQAPSAQETQPKE